MHINELQVWVKEDWEKNSTYKPDAEDQFLNLIEECGELAEARRIMKGKKPRKGSEVDLPSEAADVLISLLTICNTFDVNLEKEVEKFKNRIDRRHKEGF